MAVAQRACLLVCLAAGVGVCRPAAAGMTMVFRDASGQTRTLYQEGSRVRLPNPSGDDDGEAAVVDLQSHENFLVYDEAKAYFDFNKAIAVMRPLVERARKAAGGSKARRPPASYRPLHQTRTVNGHSCEMYERVVARRVESEVCFALWGDEFGPAEDFAWFDQFSEYLVTVIEGKPTRPEMLFASAKDPGLAIWSTSTRADGTQGVQEFLKISRGPLPPAMFHPPANYKEVAQPLSPSERSRRPDVDRLGPPGDARPKGGKIVGWAVLMLVVVCGIALLVHSVVLHIAACIVLDRPRFVQALVAAAIIWLVMMVAGLFSLPPVLGLAVSVLAAFAGVKISYGAGIVQTLALFIVCGLIAALATFAGAIFGF